MAEAALRDRFDALAIRDTRGGHALAALSERRDVGRIIAIAVPAVAALAGLALALSPPLGLAVTAALVYLTIALYSLELAIVLWLPLAFLDGLAVFNLAVKAGGLLLVALWMVDAGGYRERIAATFARHPVLWASLAGLLLWHSLSLVWASDRGEVLADLWHWYADALLLLVVATTFASVRGIRLIVVAFVVGAVVSVVQGIAAGDLSGSAAVVAETGGRLGGGLGDPNFLAAAIVPAMVLALALVPGARSLLGRWALLGALPLLAIGLAASESRGGLLAAVAAMLAAIFVFKRQRARVVGFAAVAVVVVGTWFVISPTAWERVTETESGGSGRSEIWKVALRVVEDEPVLGVGLHNFSVVSDDYVREPGSLERVDLILDRGEVVHNAYLQLLAETGVIGLALFLAVVLGCLRAAWRSIRLFEVRGESSLATLAQGYVVASAGMLAAAFFISSGVDKRLWALLALGPVLAAVAQRPRGDAGPRAPLSGASAAGPAARGWTP